MKAIETEQQDPKTIMRMINKLNDAYYVKAKKKQPKNKEKRSC